MSQKMEVRGYIGGGGIYAIVHKQSGKWYIGATQLLRARLSEHTTRMRKGEDSSSAEFNKLWAKDGEGGFYFQILENVQDHLRLRERERYWIERYQQETGFSGFNVYRKSGYSFGKVKKILKRYDEVEVGDCMASIPFVEIKKVEMDGDRVVLTQYLVGHDKTRVFRRKADNMVYILAPEVIAEVRQQTIDSIESFRNEMALMTHTVCVEDETIEFEDIYDGFGPTGEPDSIIRNGTDWTLYEHDPICDCERCRPGDPGDYEEAN